jgi:hypothetical protein
MHFRAAGHEAQFVAVIPLRGVVIVQLSARPGKSLYFFVPFCGL